MTTGKRREVLRYALVLLVVPLTATAASANGMDVYDLKGLRPGERALVELPVSFDVQSGNRLYVYGERVYSVNLAIGRGDTLMLNGVSIDPRLPPPPEAPEVVEEKWRRICGAVPFVQSRLDRGSSATDAGRLWRSKVEELESLLRDEYRRACEAGNSPDNAAELAVDRLPELDLDGLVDSEQPVSVQQRAAIFTLEGMSDVTIVPLRLEPKPPEGPSLPPMESTARDKRRLATELYETLALHAGPCWYIFDWGGTTILCGEESVAPAREQVAEARASGVAESGVLPARLVRRILAEEAR